MKQFIYLILFASFFLNLTRVHGAQAKTFTGRLDKSNGRYFLIKNSARFELHLKDPDIESVLKKLDDKDYLSVEGHVTSGNPGRNRTSKLAVSEINYVGLNDLLGFWKDEIGYCYFFSGFTSLKTFFSNAKTPCNAKSVNISNSYRPTTYNYFVSPNEDDIWSILISSKDEQFFGDLERIKKDVLNLTIYSSIDGHLLFEKIIYKADP